MNRRLRDGVCLLGLYLLLLPTYEASSAKKKTGCTYEPVYRMLQVVCSGMDLETIPTTLNGNIEIMIMDSNRLRTLEASKFKRYTSLAFLYLKNNLLLRLKEDTFEYLQYLQVLDLSVNGLSQLPHSLLQLPLLRKLYVAKNFLTEKSFPTEITSPLQYLGLEENELSEIPKLGHLAELTHLNLTMNSISRISTENIAPFCSLKTLELTKNPIQFDPSDCECYLFNLWLEKRNIKVVPTFTCSNTVDCQGMNFSNQTLESFKKCSTVVEMHIAQAKTKKTWIIVGSCIGAILLCTMIALSCFYRRNKRRLKRRKNAEKLATSNANTELLNSNLAERP